MVSLTVAPLMTVKEGSEIKDIDWNKWYFGIIPIVLFIVVTKALVDYNILTWADPLGSLLNSDGSGDVEALPFPGINGGGGGGGGAKSELKVVEMPTIASDHVQDPTAHTTNVVPERVDKSLAKRLSGHMFNDANFEATAEDGTISRDDFIARKHEG